MGRITTPLRSIFSYSALLLRFYRKFIGKGLGQIIAASIEIAMQIGKTLADGLQGLWRWPQRILIGSHLLIESVIPYSLPSSFNGFPGEYGARVAIFLLTEIFMATS
jgi:hypothetical protein